MKDRQQEIAALAYELYLNRGCLDGYEMHDWLEAEQTIAAKHLTIEALGTGITTPLAETAQPKTGTVARKKTSSAPAVPKKTAPKTDAAHKGTPKKKTAAQKRTKT